MASKRAAEGETMLKAPKSKRHKTTRTDPTSSQRGAFGDLGNTTTAPTGDSDLDCEDDSEALAYLRSVRTQASTIPHVLVAKKAGPSLPPVSGPSGGLEGEREVGEGKDVDRTIYENGVGDFRGYYQDGAYISYPEGHWDEDEEDQGDYDEDKQDEIALEDGDDSDASGLPEDQPRNSSADEIRDAYFASITNRYIALREILQTLPPDSALLGLPATNPTEVGEWKRGVNTFKKWENRLRGTDPLPAQIAAMHKDNVFRLLRVILTCKFLRKKQELRERTSRWIWALLARLPDKGELDYMEVGWIRELGKRAVLMMVSLAELEVLREHCDVAGSSPDDQDEYEVDVDVDEYFDEDFGQYTPVHAGISPTSLIMEEHTGGDFNATTPGASKAAHQISSSSTDANHEANNGSSHRPHPDDFSDVEMQLDSDMEDGEVADAPSSPLRSDPIADIETARARLLAQLNGDAADDGPVEEADVSASAKPVAQLLSATESTVPGEEVRPTAADITKEKEGYGDYEMEESKGDVDYERYQELDRAKVNERATLNMILTVAGEFYGQRDLLEFRDPFGGL
ncbi:hypothetical protein HD806DRAFT_485358 [Xylariaceae sp. AK1471]|nr:hypothetical protein HD806DRAFT_485358 [Xylariaceae sp. AK1471]